MRRRRHQGASCEDGFGEVITSNFAEVRQGGCRARGAAAPPCAGKGGVKYHTCIGNRRPVLVFLAQAVLSFVGMVVIPTRLAYEVLVVQPSPIRGAAVSLDLRSEASPRTLTTGAAAGGRGGAEGRSDRRRLGDSRGSGLWADDSEGEGLREGSKGRALQAADDEESFTYTTRTQFHLCAALPGSEITEGALRAGVMDVFGVEESQVCALVLCCFAHVSLSPSSSRCVLRLGASALSPV